MPDLHPHSTMPYCQ